MISVISLPILLGLYFLYLFNQPNIPDVVLSNISKVYEVVKIRHPKHFNVDLLDVENGNIYRSLYISKHCAYSYNLKLHSRWSFNEVLYESKEGVRYKKIEGVDSLCKQLKDK